MATISPDAADKIPAPPREETTVTRLPPTPVSTLKRGSFWGLISIYDTCLLIVVTMQSELLLKGSSNPSMTSG